MTRSSQARRAEDSQEKAGLITHHRFTVEQYHRMGDLGLFRPEERVELIEGEVVEMSPIGATHASHVDRLNALLSRRLAKLAIVRVQSPIMLNRRSEPQPDLTVLRPHPDYYSEHHPRPDDVWLVIEVSDSARQYDRKVKLPLYARAGVREVWIVDLIDAAIDIHRDPVGAWYRDVTPVQRGKRVSMQAFPKLVFRVNEILG